MNNRWFILQGKDILIQVMLLIMVTELSGVQFGLKSYAWFQNWMRAGVGCAVLVFLFHWLGKRCNLEQKMVRFGNKSHCWESIRLHGSPVISRLYMFKLATPNNFWAGTRTVDQIKLLFTYKKGDFCAISVTERGCSAPISKVELVYRIAFRVGRNSYIV